MTAFRSPIAAGVLTRASAQLTPTSPEGAATCNGKSTSTNFRRSSSANLLGVAPTVARCLLGRRTPFGTDRRGEHLIRRAGELARIQATIAGHLSPDAGAVTSGGSEREVHWHGEVDVVCIGAGVSGLATAISVVDRGGEVFVASGSTDRSEACAASEDECVHGGMCRIVSDRETIEYFAALTSDLDRPSRPDEEIAVPVRVVYEPAPIPRGGFVPPFVGSRLRSWAPRCLASPSGYLYTRVVGWQSATLHTPDGESIEVAEIGSMTPDPDDVGGSVYEWLSAEARQRHIESHPGALQRLVFDDGDVVGALFATSVGPLAIRARHGVLIATGDRQQIATAARQHLRAGRMNLRVSLVGQTASRFGRVELLTTDPTVGSALSVDRRPHASLRK